MDEPVVIEVGGKRFVPAGFDQISIEQDGWITAKLERAGASDPGLKDLKPAARLDEIHLRVLESGQIGALLAGFFVEEGAAWSQPAALVAQRLFSGPQPGGIRALLFPALEGVLNGFFGGGKASGAPIGKPSTPTVDDVAPTPASSGASTADTGSPSSEPSGATPPTELPADSAGGSETDSPLISTT